MARRMSCQERSALPDGRRYAPWEPAITLERHSYQAALCDADTIAVTIVVHHRLKRQGRGWRRDNAQAMLAALSELHSGRFEWTWQRT